MRISGMKKIFADAFLLMVEIKPIDKIIVQDLLDACGVVRQTFYNHFRDKNDLICWIYSNNVEQIFQYYADSGDLAGCFRDVCRMITEHKTFYTKAIQLEGQNNLIQKVSELTLAYFTQYIQTHCGVETLDDATLFAIDFYCCGGICACRKWILSGMQRPADEMAALLLRCMPQELKRYFPDINKE